MGVHRHWWLTATLISILTTCCECHFFDNSGPWIIATKGEPWPQVENRIFFDSFFTIDPNFRFEVINNTEDIQCDILANATQRYIEILKRELELAKKIECNPPKGQKLGILSVLRISVANLSTCYDIPSLSMDEKYEILIKDAESSQAVLTADSVWGILRGLETFSQLLFATGDKKTLSIKSQYLNDKPYYKYRGLLLDTSRHYLPLLDIKLTLDSMSYNKFNVFHWHIVDDNSFPYQSTKYPFLSEKGAYHSEMIYTKENVLDIINYARLRGIRVIPEFDSPGHVASWGLGYPDLVTTCYGKDGKPNGRVGPLNPSNPEVFNFVANLFDEVTQLFPDDFFHLGGDEVPFDCWNSNPDIRAFMIENHISTPKKLEEMYILRVMNITKSLRKNSIVWEEVFNNGAKIPQDTVVHVWRDNYLFELRRITNKGYRVILSSCWYLDHMGDGSDADWKKFYNCSIHCFKGNKELLIGGEACMWGEFVDRTNVHPRIWPRASAIAERLWRKNQEEMLNVEERLEEHACRMNRRGVPAQPPNRAGFCVL